MKVFCFVLLLLTAAAAPSGAQYRGFQAASVLPPPTVTIEAGEEAVVAITIRIRRGYHINSDAPAESYLIPTRLTWEAGPLTVVGVEFPEPEIVRYDFSRKPLSVFSTKVVLKTRFRAPPELPAEFSEIAGKLRYQACNDKACLAPTSVEFKVPVRVK